MQETNLTVLVAHPDDELLFLWPFLIAKESPVRAPERTANALCAIPKATRIVAAVSDRDNVDRAWCARRAEALQLVGRELGVETICLDHWSEFYRRDARNLELRAVVQDVTDLLDRLPGPIATHNPWGEYGHLDHVLLHLAARGTGRAVYMTDMQLTGGPDACPARWLSLEHEWAPGEFLGRAELDRPLFDRLKAIYVELGCWTWAWAPVERCGVYVA